MTRRLDAIAAGLLALAATALSVLVASRVGVHDGLQVLELLARRRPLLAACVAVWLCAPVLLLAGAPRAGRRRAATAVFAVGAVLHVAAGSAVIARYGHLAPGGAGVAGAAGALWALLAAALAGRLAVRALSRPSSAAASRG